VDVDPIASMRCWALTVELGGRDFDIPPLPAVDWWPVLTGGTAEVFLDLLRSDSGSDLDEMLLSGQITGDELYSVMSDAIEEATGRSLHVAFVLATVAQGQWPVIGGALAQAGFRWDVMPIGAALDAIHAVIMAGLDEGNTRKFQDLLENETISRPGRKRAPSQRVMNEFESMAGPRPAPAPLPGKATGAPSGSPRPRTRTRLQQPRQTGRRSAPRTQP
jgi:hypothetical protein